MQLKLGLLIKPNVETEMPDLYRYLVDHRDRFDEFLVGTDAEWNDTHYIEDTMCNGHKSILRHLDKSISPCKLLFYFYVDTEPQQKGWRVVFNRIVGIMTVTMENYESKDEEIDEDKESEEIFFTYIQVLCSDKTIPISLKVGSKLILILQKLIHSISRVTSSVSPIIQLDAHHTEKLITFYKQFGFRTVRSLEDYVRMECNVSDSRFSGKKSNKFKRRK